MSSGFDPVSLAVFTTLAPAGAVAFLVLALARLAAPDHADAVRIDRVIALPFATALLGFIASATHLGTPANALHVFSGVGTSPLSNEVLAAVIFLFLVGAYWMCAFKINFPDGIADPWLVVASLAAVAFIACTSLAYAARTVPTWDTVFTPVNLILAALMAGTLLALLFLAVARIERPLLNRALMTLSLVALVFGLGSLLLQQADLATIGNNETTALSLVPHYPLVIAAFALLGVGAEGLGIFSLRRSLARRGRIVVRVAASLLAVAAVLAVRTAFYNLHMTVGF
ncbi:dimethyl sulfoxide reductase anchor subunit [Adlercreutzia equolifaciens]|uniref:dimethyl sulfoxide reductase anchor subunit family protein n=1 Tax=Adlercreutzia equolifaciens TaxID=446660 RepID=UPI0023B00136|nr:DmsC/YnfH family molybdoenzyme membrane anchor subunit [Adlercreutzia equolifaciens]MDE8703489.1 dimethyl sulfoxide reductase anchor subunit [Adlercreutzia equolifaciens]